MKNNRVSKERILTIVLMGMFVVMLVLTIVSRVRMTYVTPIVKSTVPKVSSIEHEWNITSVIGENVDIALFVPEGIHIENSYVNVGSVVKKGDVLLKLSMAELQLRRQELEVEKNALSRTIRYIGKKDEKALLQQQLVMLEDEIRIVEHFIEKDGYLISEYDGNIKNLAFAVGQTTPSDAVIQIGVLDCGFVCEFMLSVEDTAYFCIGESVTVTDGTKKCLAEIVGCTLEADGQYRMLVSGDEIIFMPGEIIQIQYRCQSNHFDYVVPVSAIYSANSGGQYVYVEREIKTILGTELCVEKVMVDVKDSNVYYAGINSPELQMDDQVIVEASESLEEGDIVREK